MMKTERLYYTDCYLREFDASVLSVEPFERGFRVYLDRSAFYPESGGQPADRGTIAGIAVADVIDEGESVAHVLEHKPAGPHVTGQIDWTRRFDHMQQHTGQHILSAAFDRLGGYKTVSFHLGSETSTIDLDSDRLARRQIDEAEDLANQVIFENRAVGIHFKSAEEANAMGLRKATEREGEVRLVEIVGLDLSACGGTHVNQTGAVGIVTVRKFERLKSLTRVEFLCGRRAFHAARADYAVLTESARMFSGTPGNLPALISKQGEDLRAAFRARERLTKRLAEHEAKELWTNTVETNGRRVVRRIFATEDRDEAKMIAHALARQPGTVALIAVRGDPASLYFAQTPGGTTDMGAILKQVVVRVGGKGGGTRDFAQGGGMDEKQLEEALGIAESLL